MPRLLLPLRRALLALVLAVATLTVVPQLAGRADAAPSFKAPWKCGETWNASTYSNHGNNNNAVDFALRRNGVSVSNGLPVLASAAGTVTQTYANHPSGGNFVRVSHGGGWTTYYGHLSGFAVRNGQNVAAGDVLGYVGNTGQVEPRSFHHLHYEQELNSVDQRVLFDGTPADVYLGPNTDSRGRNTSTNCGTAGNPFGSGTDTLTSPANGKIRVAGWAIDPDARTASIPVHVYVGGPAGSGEGHALTADVRRDDVANANPGAGSNHGFDTTIDVGRGGAIPVYVYGINAGGTPGSNVLLGSGTVQVGSPVPVGSFDSVSSPSPGRLRVAGWAFDPDAKTQPLRIHAYVGGPVGTSGAEFHDLGLANKPRADVPRVHPGAGRNQGFDVVFDTGRSGNVPVYLYAINAPGTSGSNPQIGARTTPVKDPQPFGAFDSATTPTAGAVDVSGWVIDPSTPRSALVVHVYVGGPAGDPNAELHAITADERRDDVGRMHQGTGSHHGFAASLTTRKRGPQPVFAYAINTGAGENRLIGQRSVDVATPSPIASLARPTVSGRPLVGQRVTAAPGRWSVRGLNVRYQWLRNGTAIRGATSKSYRITRASRGKRLSVRVTVSRPGYVTASRTSTSTRKVN